MGAYYRNVIHLVFEGAENKEDEDGKDPTAAAEPTGEDNRSVSPTGSEGPSKKFNVTRKRKM